MLNLFFSPIYNDVAEPWQIGFQDSAAPGFDGIVQLHDSIFFYLILISVGVFWMLFAIIKNFSSAKSSIVYKYLNHGKIVPTLKNKNNKQKGFKFNNLINNNVNYSRLYSTIPLLNLINVKFYDDPFLLKKLILKDNKGKSGIYKWTNKLTNDIYIGQSKNLANRFMKYFNLSYLKDRNTLVIHRALLKYGYSNFTLEILEYCDIINLTEREQYYIDILNPKYNTLKIAGSSLGHKLTEETKIKISNSLKENYINKQSTLIGRTHTEETKILMALKKSKENNPMFGKTHNIETKDLMKQKALGRKHSSETLLKMSATKGYPVYIYEKCDIEGFKLIGSFVSIRRAAKFLDISSTSIRLYINSGKIFKDKYKFSSKIK